MLRLLEEFQTYIFLAAGLIFAGYVIKKYVELKKQSVKALQAQSNKTGNKIELPDTIVGGFATAEQGLIMQIQQIEQKCEKEGINVENETSYKMLKANLESIQKWKNTFQTNPIAMAADQYIYPMIKELVPDGIKMMQRLMKSA